MNQYTSDDIIHTIITFYANLSNTNLYKKKREYSETINKLPQTILENIKKELQFKIICIELELIRRSDVNYDVYQAHFKSAIIFIEKFCKLTNDK